MKFRRHHNNKGYRQIKNGKLGKQINYIKHKLKIKPNNVEFGKHRRTIMSEEIKLDKRAKVFKMADGKSLIIGEEDYQELRIAIVTEMMVNADNRVYLAKDVAMERAKFMERVYNSSKSDMDDVTKNKYLVEMLSVLKENDYKIITFAEEKARLESM